MVDHPNIAIMRNAVAAFGSGDPERLAQAFAPDVEWRVPGRSALAGVYRGQTEVFGFFGALMRESNGSFRINPLELYASDEGGVFVDRITAERGGKKLDVELVLRVQIADGKITRGIDHFHQEHAWDAFWA